jgi:hypothetical protein
MGLTDDPFYKKMTEGYDTRLLVGTLTVKADGPSGPRAITFPLFLVDYHDSAEDMEKLVAETIDEAKKINLSVKDGAYSVNLEERGTVVMFSEGETAAHTAPNFWAQYTPDPEEHKMFQQEYAKMGAWMFAVITKKNLREFLVASNGDILLKKTRPLTDDLRKMWGLKP